jgi:hypothetical protein
MRATGCTRGELSDFVESLFRLGEAKGVGVLVARPRATVRPHNSEAKR